jgi:beta-glucosidase
MIQEFGSDFLFGVATASYQIEGAVNEDGRGKTVWDTFCETPGKVARGESGAVANDHYHRYLEDIQIMKQMGVQAYRFSMAWSRMFPEGDERREQRGFDFYNRLIDALLDAGIEPIATLYHWDLPQALQDRGGWASREVPERLGDYASAAAAEFGDRVTRFAPINEPWVMSWLGYGLGYHAPGISDFDQAIAASHHTMLGHNKAFKAIKAVRPNAKVGPVLSQSHPDVDDISDPKQLRAAAVFDMNQNKFWMDAFLAGQYPELAYEIYGERLTRHIRPGDLELLPNDFVGINYYFNTRIGHEVEPTHPNRVRVVDELAGLSMISTSVGQVTDMGWPITPYGLEDLLVRWTREYPETLPQIFITENGAAYDDEPGADGRVRDQRRIDYLNDHLLALKSAIGRGANIGGYMQWSMMDNFEWAVGFAKRFGIVHVDYETQKRTIKGSGYWYRDTIATRGRNLKERFVDFA